MQGCMDGCMDWCIDGCMDGWISGSLEEQVDSAGLSSVYTFPENNPNNRNNVYRNLHCLGRRD